MDTIENIRAYVEAINEGSFAAAARKLGSSRALVSKYVSQLETLLGIKLVRTTTRSIIMTEAGEAYYNRAKDILNDYDELNAITSGEVYEPKGNLRVSMPQEFALKHIIPGLYKFTDTYPEILLDITFNNRNINLTNEGYDIALEISKNINKNVIARKITSFSYVLCASRDYLTNNGGLRTPEDLKDHNCIVDLSLDNAFLWPFKDGSKSFNIEIAPYITVNNSDACIMLSKENQGVALCPTYLVEPEIEKGQLVNVLSGWTNYDVDVYVTYPFTRSVSTKTRAFTNFVTGLFENTKY
jgi:DNA-binding transcriptional LysR family regulator